MPVNGEGQPLALDDLECIFLNIKEKEIKSGQTIEQNFFLPSLLKFVDLKTNLVHENFEGP